jgi:hypothetical protein
MVNCANKKSDIFSVGQFSIGVGMFTTIRLGKTSYSFSLKRGLANTLLQHVERRVLKIYMTVLGSERQA